MYPHMIFSTIESRGAHLKFEPDEKLIERIHKITQIDAQSMNSPNEQIIRANTQHLIHHGEVAVMENVLDFFPGKKLDVSQQ